MLLTVVVQCSKKVVDYFMFLLVYVVGERFEMAESK
jgi:hypothetical protein